MSTAIPQFFDIINAGITLVTLMDRKVFTQKSIDANQFDIIYSIMLMALANIESQQKSDRLKKTWEQKRANILNRKLTAVCPYWLEKSADSTTYHKINGRLQIIEKIFQMKLSGKSPHVIEGILNQTPGIWNQKKVDGVSLTFIRFSVLRQL